MHMVPVSLQEKLSMLNSTKLNSCQTVANFAARETNSTGLLYYNKVQIQGQKLRNLRTNLVSHLRACHIGIVGSDLKQVSRASFETGK